MSIKDSPRYINRLYKSRKKRTLQDQFASFFFQQIEITRKKTNYKRGVEDKMSRPHLSIVSYL